MGHFLSTENTPTLPQPHTKALRALADEAEQKAYIDDKKVATVMSTAGHLAKENKSVEIASARVTLGNGLA